MFGVGIPELVLILVLLVFLFGAKRIPDLARGLGSGIRNFKRALGEGDQGDDDPSEEALSEDGESRRR